MTPTTEDKTAYNDAPDDFDIEFMIEQILKLSEEKQIRLLNIIIEKNYISK